MSGKRLAALLCGLASAPAAAVAGMVSTLKPPPDELQRQLREVLAGDPARVARLLGQDAPPAGLSPLLIQLIVYGAIVGLVMLIGAIAIIGYGFSKKEKEEERLTPP